MHVVAFRSTLVVEHMVCKLSGSAAELSVTRFEPWKRVPLLIGISSGWPCFMPHRK